MKFLDKVTGNTLDTENAFTIDQFQRRPERYQPVGGTTEAADPMAEWTVDELKGYAASHNIDVGNATSAGGILKKIRAVEPLES